MTERAPFQILVVPFARRDAVIAYGLLRRNSKTGGYLQFVAGGGEGRETPDDAARRESHEEIGSSEGAVLINLDSLTMIPVEQVCGFKWGLRVLVIPQYCYGIELETQELTLSNEHTEYVLMQYEHAMDSLKWESNKIALWELNHRLKHDLVTLVV